MRSLGHTYVDLLKVDVEGSEWEIIPKIDWKNIKVGQIQMEIHPVTKQKGHEADRTTMGDVEMLFRILEEAGYRALSVEPVGFPPGDSGSQPVEAVFLHRSWTPAGFATHSHADSGVR